LAQFGLGLLEVRLLGLLRFTIFGELGLDLVGRGFRFKGFLESIGFRAGFAEE